MLSTVLIKISDRTLTVTVTPTPRPYSGPDSNSELHFMANLLKTLQM